MAVTITRTPWIDDDGTGTTGTVINNAVKTELYDQIDAGFAQVDPAAAVWTDVPFSAANFTALTGSGGTWSVTAGQVLAFSTCRQGNVLFVNFYCQNTTIGGSPYGLSVTVPVGLVWRAWALAPAPIKFAGPTAGNALLQAQPGTSSITIYRDYVITPFPTGLLDIGFTLILPL